jgi:tripartite-type tricarboxylate transporter receptor subunit TctC
MTTGKVLPMLLVTLAILIPIHAGAAAPEEYYKDKTVRFVVGYSSGGGFDRLTRMVARHIGKYLPGRPATLVDNMPGAGSALAANYLYNRTKPDGLTIGMWNGGLITQQVLGTGRGMEFDARRFHWLGAPSASNQVCALTKASGITSVEKWLAEKKPIKIGGTAPGNSTDDVPRILSVALGLPLQVVGGYKGTADIRLAAESGEVDGACWGWETMKSTWPGIQRGEVKVLVQAMPEKHPDLREVPNAIDLVKTKESRQLIEAGIHDPSTIIYLFSLAPETPKDRVQQLRMAFAQTFKDAGFLAEAEKGKQEIAPISGEEVEKVVSRLFKLEPGLVGKLKEAVTPKK